MSKRKRKYNDKQNVKGEGNISHEKIIEIQEEAYYRAFKRIENEKKKANEVKIEKKKYKWYEKILFVFNVWFWPWKINKRFSIRNQIYDSILVLFVSGVLEVIGGVMWLSGILLILNEICKIFKLGITDKIINIIPIAMLFLSLGSMFVLAGEEFGKESDSNKIYAYSASIMALISCVISIIAIGI